jgi:AraC family transcriptional regulator of adaptative response/methylated-DNA-[protein]-cysteine methyltransferase
MSRPPSDEEWLAISARQRRYDGCFVWVALRTSIYCRPSCAARRPRRPNVVVLRTAVEAERRGYCACARCHPETDAPPYPETRIAVALAYIHAHPERPVPLRTLSGEAGVTPTYFQQLFTRLVGMSPKKYCHARRLRRLRALLRSERSVADAAYAAGYGSSRALYEKASRRLGMSPATYKRGGAGTRVSYFLLHTRPGRLMVALTERGVCAVLLGRSDAELVAELSRQLPRARLIRGGRLADGVRRAIRRCEIEGPLLRALPVGLRCELFEARVASALSV